MKQHAGMLFHPLDYQKDVRYRMEYGAIRRAEKRRNLVGNDEFLAILLCCYI